MKASSIATTVCILASLLAVVIPEDALPADH